MVRDSIKNSLLTNALRNRFAKARSEVKGKVCMRVILPDPKLKTEKDISLCPTQSYDSHQVGSRLFARVFPVEDLNVSPVMVTGGGAVCVVVGIAPSHAHIAVG